MQLTRSLAPMVTVRTRTRFLFLTRRSKWYTSLLLAAATASGASHHRSSTMTTIGAALVVVPPRGQLTITSTRSFRSMPLRYYQDRSVVPAGRKLGIRKCSVADSSSASDNNNNNNNNNNHHGRPSTEEDIERIVLDWVKRIVIGWNLCPFAEKPLKTGTMHVHIVRGSDDVAILGAILGELLVRKRAAGTSLIVTPEWYPDDFRKFLSAVTALEEDLMDDHDLHGHVQIAPFHPLFEFEGSGEAGIDNYTNRAPFPIFHVLREEEVERAVDKLQGDAGKVWRRNVLFLEDLKDTLGTDGVKRAVSGDVTEKEAVALEEALRRHRFKTLDQSATESE